VASESRVGARAVARSLGINQGHRGRAKRTARAACGGMEERGDASDGLTGRRYAQVCAYHGERIGVTVRLVVNILSL
jgi:hypothetical protein